MARKNLEAEYLEYYAGVAKKYTTEELRMAISLMQNTTSAMYIALSTELATRP